MSTMSTMSISSDLKNMHRMYDILAWGICAVDSDDEESVLFANRKLLECYDCKTEEEFMSFSGGRFSGMTLDTDVHMGDLAVGQRPRYLRFQFRTREKRVRIASAAVSREEMDGRPVYFLQIRFNGIEEEDLITDELTGLPGEREFYQRAISMSKEKKDMGDFTKFCPTFFNIANFRGYNRVHGTEAGDRVLSSVADMLVEAFPQGLFGHLSGDNFAAILPRDGVFDKLTEVCHKADRLIGDASTSFKAGIVTFDSQVSQTVLLHSFDMAKIACASVKNNAQTSWAIYTEQMHDQVEMRQYILDNFDRALKEGYIKVFYQPVIHVLSGKVCSCEALSRWEDPEKGFISPGVFVPILEDAHLVGRLDAYVIDNVMRLLHDRLAAGSNVIPVSLNLSRLDFALIQPLQRIEDAIKKYNIPKKYIHVEITETILAQNGENLAKEIENFNRAGYEVWLDDFGSEYSSLKTLHNYNFNMLKIDMGFFSNFNKKGRDIIESVVYMAKRLGMHTLAEGVETREQVDFLHSIGCERIQGFYYGKPMQVEMAVMDLAKKHIGFEQEKEYALCEAAGQVNIAVDTPAAIFTFNGRDLRMLAANDAYIREMRKSGMQDIDDANRQLSDTSSRLNARLINFVAKVYDDREDTIVYVWNDHYMRLWGKKIAGDRNFWIGQTSLLDLTKDTQRSVTARADNLAKNMLLYYDGLYCAEPDDDSVEVLTTMHTDMRTGGKCAGISNFVGRFAEKYVLAEDRSRFFNFADPENMMAEAKASGRGEAEDLFRVRLSEDDTYRWMVFRAVKFDDVNKNKKILISEHEDLWERYRNRAGMLPLFASSFSVAVRTDVSEPAAKKPDRVAEAAEEASAAKDDTNAVATPVTKDSALLGFEAWTDDVITQGMSEPDPSVAIRKSIMLIAENLYADRFLIFEKRDADSVSCTYEWCRRGMIPLKHELQGIAGRNMAALYRVFSKHRVAIIPDVEEFTRKNPDFLLPIANVRNIISGMLTVSGTPIGFTMVLNSSDGNINTNGYMLATLTNFLGVLIRHRDMIADALEKSRRDALTGALNRYGIALYFENRENTGSFALIVTKLRNLREINGEQGYAAGDMVLCRLYQILRRIADDDRVFRLDGDEFLLTEEKLDEAGIRQMREKIRNACLAEGIRATSGYAVHEGKLSREQFEQMLNTAEKNSLT